MIVATSFPFAISRFHSEPSISLSRRWPVQDETGRAASEMAKRIAAFPDPKRERVAKFPTMIGNN